MLYPFESAEFQYNFSETNQVKSLFTSTDLINNSSFKYNYVLLESFTSVLHTNKFKPKGILFLDNKDDAEKYHLFIADYLNTHNGHYSHKEFIYIDENTKILDILNSYNTIKSNGASPSLCLSRFYYTNLIEYLSLNKDNVLENSFYENNFITNETDHLLTEQDLIKIQKHIVEFVTHPFTRYKYEAIPQLNIKSFHSYSDLVFNIDNQYKDTISFSNPMSSLENYGINYIKTSFSHKNKDDFLRIASKNNIALFKKIITNYFKSYKKIENNKGFIKYLSTLINETPIFTNLTSIYQNCIQAMNELVNEGVINKADYKEIKKDTFLQPLNASAHKEIILEHFQALALTNAFSDKEIANHFISYVNHIHKKKHTKNKFTINKEAVMNLVLANFTLEQINIIKDLNTKQRIDNGLSILLEKFQQKDPNDFLSNLASSNSIFLNDLNNTVILFEVDTNALVKLFPSSFNNLVPAFLGSFAKTFNLQYSSNSVSNKNIMFDRFIFKTDNNELQIDQKFIRELLINFLNEFSQNNIVTSDKATKFINNFLHASHLNKKLTFEDKYNHQTSHIRKKI